MEQDNWEEIKSTRQFTMKELEILTGIKDMSRLKSIAKNWIKKEMELVKVRNRFIKEGAI
jgi:hypothetical protein